MGFKEITGRRHRRLSRSGFIVALLVGVQLPLAGCGNEMSRFPYPRGGRKFPAESRSAGRTPRVAAVGPVVAALALRAVMDPARPGSGRWRRCSGGRGRSGGGGRLALATVPAAPVVRAAWIRPGRGTRFRRSRRFRGDRRGPGIDRARTPEERGTSSGRHDRRR